MTDFTATRRRVRAAQLRLVGLRTLDLAVIGAGAMLVAFLGALSGAGLA